MYSTREYAEMVFVYGFCNGNASLARLEYQRRYPNRRIPCRRAFADVYQRLVNTGSAVANNRERRSDAAAEEVEGGILRAVEVQPSVSVRRLAVQLQLPRTRVHRTLQNNGLYPFHLTPVQDLLPGDAQRRVEFCQWLLRQQEEDEVFIKNILWTDEAQFTRDGVTNHHNLHHWSDSNPHLIRTTSFQR